MNWRLTLEHWKTLEMTCIVRMSETPITSKQFYRLHLKHSLQQKYDECSQLQNLLNDTSTMKQRDKDLRETVALAQVKILDL